jgi:serine kinase of HPr protein (carbohydrate metabolism regulator)
MLVHGTCVALGSSGALIRGAPGTGKSDLALRFLYLAPANFDAQPALVADDQVLLERDGARLIASCPGNLKGKIEVRGIGIVSIAQTASAADLRVFIDVDNADEAPRLPDAEYESVLGVSVRRFRLDPFEPSAPLKLAIAIQSVALDVGD